MRQTDVPSSHAGPDADIQLVVGANKGIQSLNMKFVGRISVEDIATGFGFKWSLSKDVLSVTNPSLKYTASPFSLGLASTITIPFLRFNATGSLLINGPSDFSVGITQPFTIIPGIVLNPRGVTNGFILSLASNNGSTSFYGNAEASGECGYYASLLPYCNSSTPPLMRVVMLALQLPTPVLPYAWRQQNPALRSIRQVILMQLLCFWKAFRTPFDWMNVAVKCIQGINFRDAILLHLNHNNLTLCAGNCFAFLGLIKSGLQAIGLNPKLPTQGKAW